MVADGNHMHDIKFVSGFGVDATGIHSPEAGWSYSLPVEAWDRLYGQWSLFPDGRWPGDVQCQWLEHYYTAHPDEGGVGDLRPDDLPSSAIRAPIPGVELPD